MSNLSPREQWKLNYLKHQETEKLKNELKLKKSERKPKKLERKTRNMSEKAKKCIEAKAEYLVEWRKRNPDKVLGYRTAVKNDPVRYAHALEYDRNRPNLSERMLENKLRARERMKNPIYAKKEFYRNKLRRKYLTDDERIKFKTLYEQYNKEWKECNEKIRIARKSIENKA